MRDPARWTLVVLGGKAARSWRFGRALPIAALSSLFMVLIGAFALGSAIPGDAPLQLGADGGEHGDVPPIAAGMVDRIPTATRAEPMPSLEERPPPQDARRPSRCSGIRTPDRGPFGNRVALTFDDGPTRSTRAIMRVLRRHNVPATFFVSAERLSEPRAIETLREIEADPLFDVGNHGFQHEDLSQLAPEQVVAELEQARDAFRSAQVDTGFFRFPFGRASCVAASYVRIAGHRIVGWNIDSADWCFDRGQGRCNDTERFGRDVRGRTMTRYVVEQVQARRGGIVLFHDDLPFTAHRVEGIVEELADASYTFVRLSDEETFAELNDSAAERRARRLGLGRRVVGTALMQGRVRGEWIAAAGGVRPPSTLQIPVEHSVVSRGYGSGEGGYHLAVDVAGIQGAEVHAVADGLVGYSGDELTGYGNTVVIIHPGGLVSFSAHNEANLVVAGEMVERGQTIGTVGQTGLARGPHVHFELAFREQTCDPAPLFRPMPVSRRGPIEGLTSVEWTDRNAAPVPCQTRRDHPETSHTSRVASTASPTEPTPAPAARAPRGSSGSRAQRGRVARAAAASSAAEVTADVSPTPAAPEPTPAPSPPPETAPSAVAAPPSAPEAPAAPASAPVATELEP